MKRVGLLAVLLVWTFMICPCFAEYKIISQHPSIGYFINTGYESSVIKKNATVETRAPGLDSVMKIKVIQNETGEYWRVYDGTLSSWGPSGDTTAWLDWPIEIEFFIYSDDAVNLRDDTVPSNLTLTALEFRFGGDTLYYHYGLRLFRSFFQTYSAENGVQARGDRTDRWAILSIQRSATGHFTGLKVADYNGHGYVDVPASEYTLFRGVVNGQPVDVDWTRATFKQVDGWGKAPAPYSFYIGRMAFGHLLDVKQCGDPHTVYFSGDFDQDCYVDMKDLAIISSQWLDSSEPALQ